MYNYGEAKIIFPKDAEANGSWIVLKDNGDALCLLNGAFQNHTPNNNHTTSRGQIVLALALNKNIITAFEHVNLLSVAPFTLIVVNNNQLFECRWDATKKNCKQLNNTIPHIWSSATLYNMQQQQMRNVWFNTWLNTAKNISLKDVVSFHTNAGEQYKEAAFVMKEKTVYSTVSITCIAVNENEYSMHYKDLIYHDSFTKITIKTSILCK